MGNNIPISLTILKNRDAAYGLAVIWAYIGIYIKHNSSNGWNAAFPSIMFTAVASIVISVAVEGYTLFNLRQKDKKLGKYKRTNSLIKIIGEKPFARINCMFNC